MNEHRHEAAQRHYCFRCQGGCIHLVCGSTMVTLSAAQFLALSDAVIALRGQLQAEGETPAASPHSSPFLM